MRHLPFVLAGLLVSATTSLAQDWTQWRGPARDGAVPAAVVPKAWPASTSKTWQVEVGEGYASPVVANGRVFIHSRTDPHETVMAIDLASGKVVWRQTYAAAFQKNQYAKDMAKGPNSTPLVAGSRVYTLGVTGVLSAWNAADGTLAWRQDYSPSIDTSKLFCGTAMSPMIEGGSLIVQVGSDVHGGRVLALDPATGKERWTWKGLGPGYASPLAVTIGGVRQLITFTNGSIIGLNAGTGAGLWSVPFPDEWHENIVSPIWTGTHVVVSGLRQGTQAYAIAQAPQNNGTWTATQAWKNAEVTMYTSSPVYADGRIYGMSNKRRGQFVALDAETGAVKWATVGRDGNHASILLAPNHVLFLNDGGVLLVARRGDTFVEEKRIEIGSSATWAVPVLLADGLLVREANHLVRLAWGH
jgi:outer membrane protein assembly factor BamB